jgi:hypothetical protein
MSGVAAVSVPGVLFNTSIAANLRVVPTRRGR